MRIDYNFQNFYGEDVVDLYPCTGILNDTEQGQSEGGLASTRATHYIYLYEGGRRKGRVEGGRVERGRVEGWREEGQRVEGLPNCHPYFSHPYCTEV